MDGLSGMVPLDKPISIDQTALPDVGTPEPEVIQYSLFDLLEDKNPKEEKEPKKTIPLCVIYDWEEDLPKTYVSLRNEGVQ